MLGGSRCHAPARSKLVFAYYSNRSLNLNLRVRNLVFVIPKDYPHLEQDLQIRKARPSGR